MSKAAYPQLVLHILSWIHHVVRLKVIPETTSNVGAKYRVTPPPFGVKLIQQRSSFPSVENPFPLSQNYH